MWMRHMHPILRRQQLDYRFPLTTVKNSKVQCTVVVQYTGVHCTGQFRVFVVEQSDSWPFNRAALMNAGVSEARRLGGDFSCFVFHDVDILPEDDRAVYTCPQVCPVNLVIHPFNGSSL